MTVEKKLEELRPILSELVHLTCPWNPDDATEEEAAIWEQVNRLGELDTKYSAFVATERAIGPVVQQRPGLAIVR